MKHGAAARWAGTWHAKVQRTYVEAPQVTFYLECLRRNVYGVIYSPLLSTCIIYELTDKIKLR